MSETSGTIERDIIYKKIGIHIFQNVMLNDRLTLCTDIRSCK